MKNGTCPKCGSTEILRDLPLHGGEGYPPFVSIAEPEPAKRPFLWLPNSEQSQFRAYVCVNCGYTEFYTQAHQALEEGYKKGYQGS